MDENANGMGSPKKENPKSQLITQNIQILVNRKKLMSFRRFSTKVSWPFTHNVSDNR